MTTIKTGLFPQVEARTRTKNKCLQKIYAKKIREDPKHGKTGRDHFFWLGFFGFSCNFLKKPGFLKKPRFFQLPDRLGFFNKTLKPKKPKNLIFHPYWPPKKKRSKFEGRREIFWTTSPKFSKTIRFCYCGWIWSRPLFRW